MAVHLKGVVFAGRKPRSPLLHHFVGQNGWLSYAGGSPLLTEQNDKIKR
jgi:hypothetical protein